MKSVFDVMLLGILFVFLLFTAEKHWNPVSPKFIANQMKVIHFKTDSYLHNLGYFCGYPVALSGDKGEWIVGKEFTLLDYFNSERVDIVKKEYRSCTKQITQAMSLKTFSNFTDIPQPIKIQMQNKIFSLIYLKKDISPELLMILSKDFIVKVNNQFIEISVKK